VQNSLQEALLQWRTTIGPDHVATDIVTLVAAQTATFATGIQVPAILYPSSTEEVAKCLRIASEHRIPIYPVSTGKNWGNGSRVPASQGCVILDLSRMNRIIDFNEELAYAAVEPGVTSRQMSAFLRAQNSRLRVSKNGTSPDASLIGNALERGDGGGLYGERVDYVCGLEVVLPTGEIIHTGFQRFPDARCKYLSRAGLGPGFDGLFFQSNLGVVTQMTLWLEPIPRFERRIVFAADKLDRMEKVIDQLRVLKMNNLIHSISIWNNFKVLSRVTQYSKQHRVAAWIGQCRISASSRIQSWSQKRLVMRALLPFVTRIGSVRYGDEPDENGNLQIAYWRKRTPMPNNPNPDQDGCGLIWCMPLVPFRGEDAGVAIKLMEEIASKHHFEPNLAVLGTEQRTLRLVGGIIYDREVESEDEKAMRCHDEMLQALIGEGFHPYRLGIQSMHAALSKLDATGDVWARIKSALDPEQVLAPGRYVLKR